MKRMKIAHLGILLNSFLAIAMVGTVFAQAPPPLPPPEQAPPPPLPPQQLDQLVDRIALYPDPLLAQVLAAATYPDQIPDAYRWADEHHYLTGQALADAIQADQVPWDPSVQALLPFPSVLEMMANDMNWTRRLGDAFLSQQPDVMDAVQRQRARAQQYGYLRTNRWVTVSPGPYITIVPVDPAFISVPYWDPAIVYYPPRPGFVVGEAIRFGYGIDLGVVFRPWGWGYNRFDWPNRVVVINNSPWRRTWGTRFNYVHPYTIRRPAPGPGFRPGPRPPERHPAFPRSPAEREAPHRGEFGHEEHGGRGRR